MSWKSKVSHSGQMHELYPAGNQEVDLALAVQAEEYTTFYCTTILSPVWDIFQNAFKLTISGSLLKMSDI